LKIHLPISKENSVNGEEEII